MHGRRVTFIFFSANFRSIFLKLCVNMKALKGNVVEFFSVFSDPKYDFEMNFENHEKIS